jgi:hypothetical protein
MTEPRGEERRRDEGRGAGGAVAAWRKKGEEEDAEEGLSFRWKCIERLQKTVGGFATNAPRALPFRTYQLRPFFFGAFVTRHFFIFPSSINKHFCFRPSRYLISFASPVVRMAIPVCP